MNVVVTGGEAVKKPIGNKGFYVTSERSTLLSVPEWLSRHGVERRGLSLISILKKVVFTHSCGKKVVPGSTKEIQSQYCQVARPRLCLNPSTRQP